MNDKKELKTLTYGHGYDAHRDKHYLHIYIYEDDFHLLESGLWFKFDGVDDDGRAILAVRWVELE